MIPYLASPTYEHLWNVHQQNYSDQLATRTTVFGLVWVDGHDLNPEATSIDSCTNESSPDSPLSFSRVVACTNSGELCVWTIPTSMSRYGRTDSEEATSSGANSYQKPVFRRQIAEGVLYSIKLHTDPNGRILLIVSGDVGAIVFDWTKDILPQLESSETTKLEPRARFKTHSSPRETKNIEVNDVQMHGNHLYGAAGDAFGCYKWDMETQQIVSTYLSPGRCRYMHTLELVPPSSSTSSSSPCLLTGGEGAILTLWDCSQDKLIDQMEVTSAAGASARSSSPPGKQSGKKRNNKTMGSRWISSIQCLDECWWSVGGGGDHNPSSKSGGFLSTFHAATRSIVASTETREALQNLAPIETASSLGGVNEMLSVGNEGVVSYWDPLSTERKRRVWITSPSAYAVATSSIHDMVAVGGVGKYIDILDEHCQRLTQLLVE